MWRFLTAGIHPKPQLHVKRRLWIRHSHLSRASCSGDKGRPRMEEQEKRSWHRPPPTAPSLVPSCRIPRGRSYLCESGALPRFVKSFFLSFLNITVNTLLWLGHSPLPFRPDIIKNQCQKWNLLQTLQKVALGPCYQEPLAQPWSLHLLPQLFSLMIEDLELVPLPHSCCGLPGPGTGLRTFSQLYTYSFPVLIDHILPLAATLGSSPHPTKFLFYGCFFLTSGMCPALGD